MRKKLVSVSIAMLMVFAIAPGMARAQVRGHPMALRWLFGRILEPQQKAQVHSLLNSRRGAFAALHARIRSARQKLMDDLLAGKDTSADSKELSAAQSAMLAERINIAKAVVARLTPAQRQQITEFIAKWRALREQQARLFREFGKAGSAGQPDRLGQAEKPAPQPGASKSRTRPVSGGRAQEGM